jgi:hypothetical protein
MIQLYSVCAECQAKKGVFFQIGLFRKLTGFEPASERLPRKVSKIPRWGCRGISVPAHDKQAVRHCRFPPPLKTT